MKRTWLTIGVIYLFFLCYFLVKFYVEIFIPLNDISNQNIRYSVKQVLLDDFKVSALGGYVDYERINSLAKKLSIDERKQFFRMIRLHADEIETSSEFQTMLYLIENDLPVKSR